MHSIAQRLKCPDLNVGLRVNYLDLNVRAVLTYIGLNAVTSRELPNYIDCTVHQYTGKLKISLAYNWNGL